MKRRVSFLLMLIVVFALAFALSSCGECEHETRTDRIPTNEPDCKTVATFDEVVTCTICNEELSRTSVKGELGSHIPGEAVYENCDVVDCTVGGTGDKVVYCSVAKCGAEIESKRENGVEIPKAEQHSLKAGMIKKAVNFQNIA